MAGWHLLLLDVDDGALHALRVAVDVMTAVECLEDGDELAAQSVRSKLASVDRRELQQGLVTLTHLLATQLAQGHGTAPRTVLAGLGEAATLEQTRRTGAVTA